MDRFAICLRRRRKGQGSTRPDVTVLLAITEAQSKIRRGYGHDVCQLVGAQWATREDRYRVSRENVFQGKLRSKIHQNDSSKLSVTYPRAPALIIIPGKNDWQLKRNEGKSKSSELKRKRSECIENEDRSRDCSLFKDGVLFSFLNAGEPLLVTYSKSH